MTVITDTDELARFCEQQKGADFIAVDTEFLRDNSYWPKLCLVQIGGPDEVAAIDALADGIDLKPLIDLLADEGILKVFHAGRQDLEIFYNLSGRLPRPIFDTQVAAMVCGFGEQVAYDTLARKLVGAKIDKASRFADWSRRPLSQREIDYALADVIHLRPIYEALARQLSESGRSEWLDQEMDQLTAPETYRNDPDRAWMRMKTRSSNRRHLAIVRELAKWRELEAQSRDIPRNRIIRDEQIFDIAAQRPETPEQLARTRGLSRDFARGRMGEGLIKAIKRGREVPESALPEPPARNELPPGLGPVVDLLKVLLKMKCEEHRVAQKLVANAADLEAIAASDQADVPALSGWRREVFGNDALALKHGEIALSISGRRIVPVETRASS